MISMVAYDLAAIKLNNLENMFKKYSELGHQSYFENDDNKEYFFQNWQEVKMTRNKMAQGFANEKLVY